MRWSRRTEEHRSGAEAVEAAEAVQGKAAQRWPEVHRVAERMRLLRARNQFADQIRESFPLKGQGS